MCLKKKKLKHSNLDVCQTFRVSQLLKWNWKIIIFYTTMMQGAIFTGSERIVEEFISHRTLSNSFNMRSIPLS